MVNREERREKSLKRRRRLREFEREREFYSDGLKEGRRTIGFEYMRFFEESNDEEDDESDTRCE